VITHEPATRSFFKEKQTRRRKRGFFRGGGARSSPIDLLIDSSLGINVENRAGILRIVFLDCTGDSKR